MPRPSTRNRKPKESLRVTLEHAATPELVVSLATMFAETLRQVDPELREGDVTMRVENFAAAAEVRGWHKGGERAVRLTAELVDNATEAVQEHAHLAGAARTLAGHAAKLTGYAPKFWRNDRELRAVDDVFVRTMRAAGTLTVPRDDDGMLAGETVVYSQVLRVGRLQQSGALQARLNIEGRPIEVNVAAALSEQVWEAAKSEEIVSLRLRGRWAESETGELRLERAEIIGLDLTFSGWTGHELLEDFKQQADSFTADDFERMLAGLDAPTREE